MIDGSATAPAQRGAAVTALCDALEAIDADGWYPVIEVVRPWSRHNPHMTGEFARPRTIRWYLVGELGALLGLGATITVRASRVVTFPAASRSSQPNSTARSLHSYC